MEWRSLMWFPRVAVHRLPEDGQVVAEFFQISPVGPEAAPYARYRFRFDTDADTFVAALSGAMQYVKDRGGVIYSAGKVVDTFDEVQKPLS